MSKNKVNKKKIQKEYAKKSISYYFSLLKSRFYPKFDSKYIQEIKRLQTAFNIRLSKEEKLEFCKKCSTFWNTQTREIRFNPQNSCKEYICKKCGHSRKYKYK